VCVWYARARARVCVCARVSFESLKEANANVEFHQSSLVLQLSSLLTENFVFREWYLTSLWTSRGRFACAPRL